MRKWQSLHDFENTHTNIYTYIYIYIHTHTDTHSHMFTRLSSGGLLAKVSQSEFILQSYYYIDF